jgi:hypothetical protein
MEGIMIKKSVSFFFPVTKIMEAVDKVIARWVYRPKMQQLLPVALT